MTTKVRNDRFYQHQDGGLYLVTDIATSTVDGASQFVIYDHIYPFEHKLWARPIEEWTEPRFKEIDQRAVTELMTIDRDELQMKISATKAARKARELAVKIAQDIEAESKWKRDMQNENLRLSPEL